MKYSRACGLAAGVVLFLAGCAEPVTVGEDLTSPRFTVGGEALLVCPGGDGSVVDAELGLLGGQLTNARHGLQLPVGALTGVTQFRMTVPASTIMEVSIRANGREGFSFGAVVLGWIDYSRCADLPSTALTVWKIDPTTKALLKRMPSVDDRLNRRVLFETDSLSSYSIAH